MKWEQDFPHDESVIHIKQNYEYIQSWFAKYKDIAKDFAHYLDFHCKYVVITLSGSDSLSMAFKMFDSQNGTGKPLEAYNLLKAYHMRSMSSCAEAEKIYVDKEWEASTRYCKDNYGNIKDLLRQLFNEQLYRSRVWSRKEDAYQFSKLDIGEFKGATIDDSNAPAYPSQNIQALLTILNQYNGFDILRIPTKSRFANGDPTGINPFCYLTQPITNGKDFFKFVKTYIEIYKHMFYYQDYNCLSEFHEFYYNTDFTFMYWNSVEHHYPQSRAGNADFLNEEVSHFLLNTLGNLCLISKAANSSLNKENPKDKASHYDENSNLGFTRNVIYKITKRDGWTAPQIIKHKEAIEELLSMCNDILDIEE